MVFNNIFSVIFIIIQVATSASGAGSTTDAKNADETKHSNDRPGDNPSAHRLLVTDHSALIG
jgi:hypothetical protein